MKQRKIFQLWIFDGRFKWTIDESFVSFEQALEKFNLVTNFDAKHPKRDWFNFSYKIINKQTGQVLRRHISNLRKYARID